MTWTTLLGLILCNAIWATNPVMGKVLMASHTPLQVSWLRYSSALATAIVVVLWLRWRRPEHLTARAVCLHSANLPWLASLGLITFFGSAVMQYIGLSRSTSTANALIVAMEPLFAVFLARVFLHERVRKRQMAAFVIALSGFFLLSNVKPGDLAASLSLFSLGNLFLLITMPMEAMYSIISRRLAHRVTPVSILACSLPFGFVALNFYLLSAGELNASLFTLASWRELGALLWLGPIGTTITYVYWSIALVRAPVAAVSLTLFAQPILGALAGTFFLGDRLDAWQLAGGALIVGALLLQTHVELERKQSA